MLALNNYYKMINAILLYLFLKLKTNKKTLIPKFSLKMNNRLKSGLQQNVAESVTV